MSLWIVCPTSGFSEQTLVASTLLSNWGGGSACREVRAHRSIQPFIEGDSPHGKTMKECSAST